MKITVDKFEKLRSKIVGREEALSMLKIWHYIGQKVVFTNGCFDLVRAFAGTANVITIHGYVNTIT